MGDEGETGAGVKFAYTARYRSVARGHRRISE